MPFPIQKKYTPEKFYFTLHIEKPEIPDRIVEEAEANKLNEPTNYHISIVIEKNAAILRDAISKHENPEKIKSEIAQLFQGYSWEYTLTDKYSLQEKFYSRNALTNVGLQEEPEHTRRSIIQIVNIQDIDDFYKKVSGKLNIDLNVPVPHITIFGWSDYALKPTRGIGLSSKADFEFSHKKYL